MKKLMMTAAIAALCATVAKADVTSGIVGYQQISIPKGYSFFTVTFDTLDQTDYNLSDIGCLQTSGAEWKATGSGATKSTGSITVRKIDTEGAYGTEFAYYSTKTPAGWYNGDTLIEGNAVKFASGEGMIVYCGKDAGARLQVSGTVRLIESGVGVPYGYSFSGNSSPTTINLSAIGCKQADGTAWKATGSGATKSTGSITVRKIDTEGAYGTEYAYYSTKTPTGWYDGDTLIEGNAVTFAPGEGFIVYCGKTNGAQIILPAPEVAQ